MKRAISILVGFLCFSFIIYKDYMRSTFSRVKSLKLLPDDVFKFI